MRVDLKDGEWVEVRDRESITNKDRLAYKRLLSELIDRIAEEQGIAAGKVGSAVLTHDLNKQVTAWMVTGWSFDLPLPSERADVFEDDAFPFTAYDAIQEACRPLVVSLRGVDFDPQRSDVKGRPDPDTPTETSSD